MMKDSIRQKLEKAEERFEEVGRMLADPAIAGSSDQFRELSMEYARLQPTAEAYRGYRALAADLAAATQLQHDRDAAMRALGEEEVARLNMALGAREQDLARLLLPHDPRDEGNIYLEIRAGTGGDEAAIFAGDLLRMYTRYAERRWRLSRSHLPRGRPRRVFAIEVRVRHASRAASAGN